jgi:hypothetical protein
MPRIKSCLVSAVACCVLLLSSANAQQFKEEVGLIPGPILWSEAAIPLDANDDGLLDVLFLNASGYQFPGDLGGDPTPKPPTLILNTGSVGGVPTFVDATAQYFLPSFLIHGKHAAVCDIDGDGHDDIIMAAGFGDQQRVFRKDSLLDTYVEETFRLPALVLNCFYVGWGDFDDDGDIDLVFPDAGPDAFNPPGGLARLLLNDGTGNFTEAPFPAVLKVGAQNAKVVDIDGDLDLDVIVDGKSEVTQLYINDGAANFTLDTTTIPTTDPASFGSYETEWADLDGDSDIDGLFLNSGAFYQDGGVQNLLADTLSLAMLLDNSVFSGANFQDENEFALLDSDDDGDLDVIVACLQFGGSAEKLFINNGAFGPAFLHEQVGAFSFLQEATLDLAIADFDGDGAYDVVSAQGEIEGALGFVNRYYRNTGPADTTPPRLLGVTSLPDTVRLDQVTGAGLILRAALQDSVVDDGITFASATLDWDVVKGASNDPDGAPMPHIGGGVHRGVLVAQATADGLVGAQLDVRVDAADPAGNQATYVVGSTTVCGSESYGAGTGLLLTPPPPAAPGEVFSIAMQGAANANGVLLFSFGADDIPFAGGSILVALPTAIEPLAFALDPGGSLTLPLVLPRLPALEGFTFYMQALTSVAGAKTLSAGVETVICAD